MDARVEVKNLVVLFQDHTWAGIALQRLLPQRKGMRWDRMTFGQYVIVVPTDEGMAEISWLTIRSLSDPAFGAYLDAAEREQQQIIGQLIRRWRQDQGMSHEDLARQAEIPVATLARVEAGAASEALSLLGKILPPLGRTVEDLALLDEDADTDS